MTGASPARRGAPDRATLDPIEVASRDELSALQLERLRWSLRHAHAHVAPYRAACEAAGVHPDDLRDLADLSRFPFTDKDDLRRAYPFGMFAVPRERLARVHASSGTTGKPTVVGYTARDLDTWAGLVARSIRAAGGRPGDLVHVAYGYGLFTGGLGAHYGAERLGCTVVPMSGGNTEKQVQLLADFAPQVLMCTPSYALVIADACAQQGVDTARLGLAVGIHGAEPWTEAMRAEIERRFRIDATDIYGLSEVMGPGVAQECLETKDGPVLWEDHFFPEIVDPETGRPVPDGTPGELVLTSLTKEAMPVIRYRTRDRTALLPGTARTMRRLARLSGRTDDMLIIRGVNVFPSQLEEHVVAVGAFAPHYQLEVRRDGRLDTLTLVLEPRADAADGAAHEAAARASVPVLLQRVKVHVGVTCDARVVPPGTVPRSLGKAQRVVDLR